jgi:hypothetical protein
LSMSTTAFLQLFCGYAALYSFYEYDEQFFLEYLRHSQHRNIDFDTDCIDNYFFDGM